MNINYIGQLKAIIEKTGSSQVKLAKELGVTFAALNRWINKQAVPRPAMQKVIYRLYKEYVGFLPLPDDQIKQIIKAVDSEKSKHSDMRNIIRNNRRLREDLLLELTYNSNAIEGSTLTKKETESIIFDKATIPDKSYIEHLEATNHAAALDAVFDGKFDGPVTENKIKDLHGIIIQGINPDAGKYSKHHRAIRGVNLKLPAPEDVPEEMKFLIKRVNNPKTHIIKHISVCHADFEAIHPFGDGNGRVGRLIMIIQLLNTNYAPCLINNNSKADYYDALEYAQRKSESHLVKFIAESILSGYKIITKHKK